MNNEKLKKISDYLRTVLAYWKSGTERVAGGNISSTDIELALKTNTLEGYKELVFELYKDENDTEAETLEKLIEEAEK